MAKVLWRGTVGSILLSWTIIAIFTFAFGAMVLANAYGSDPSVKISGGEWLAPLSVFAIGFIVSLAWSRASVEVDADEVRVRLGLGFTVRRFAWSRVASVECIDVRPMRWGGWGFRWIPTKHTHVLVLRAGEGLKFTLENGRVFIVTVDGAKRGLDVIRGILSDPRHAR